MNVDTIPLYTFLLSEDKFPDEVYYAAFKLKNGNEWDMRGPFLTKEQAIENLRFFRHLRCRIVTFKMMEAEELLKTRRAKESR